MVMVINIRTDKWCSFNKTILIVETSMIFKATRSLEMKELQVTFLMSNFV